MPTHSTATPQLFTTQADKKESAPHLLFRELNKMISDLLIVLSPKEKYIIEHRFGLGGSKRETLEKIGRHFKITRERVRQIEANALKKLQRTAMNTNLKILNEYGKMIIQKHGGVMFEEKVVTETIAAIQSSSENNVSNIQLSLTLDKDIIKTFNTIKFRPYWRTIEIGHKQIEELAEKIINLIGNKEDVMELTDLVTLVNQKFQAPWIKDETINSLLYIDKRVLITKEGKVGLSQWRHINPRTIRDKIQYVMKKKTQPMHFSEVCKNIIEENFDTKKVNVQAVHNELIRNAQFILIGRGIYALDEWGYKKGTVSEIIEAVLNDGKPHAQEEIITKVLDQRKIKKITILLNLKNKKRFERIGRYTYQLHKI